MGVDLREIWRPESDDSLDQIRQDGVDLLDPWSDDDKCDKKTTAAMKNEMPIDERKETSTKGKTAEFGATKLTHVDAEGRARMVDVSEKGVTVRTASARCFVLVPPLVRDLLKENKLKKGDALAVAQLAGVMAAKRTSSLIPLCHNISLTDVQLVVHLNSNDNRVEIESTIRSVGRTGVEMEALVACSVAALTVYDMCKAASTEMVVTDLRVISKTGGKRDYNAG